MEGYDPLLSRTHWAAQATSSSCDWRSSLFLMCSRWVSIVLTLTPSFPAITRVGLGKSDQPENLQFAVGQLAGDTARRGLGRWRGADHALRDPRGDHHAAIDHCADAWNSAPTESRFPTKPLTPARKQRAA